MKRSAKVMSLTMALAMTSETSEMVPLASAQTPPPTARLHVTWLTNARSTTLTTVPGTGNRS